MHVCDLASNSPSGTWVADWSQGGECDYDDPLAVIEMYQPVLEVRMRDLYPALNEMTYKELAGAIDPNFLKQGPRARELRGVYYQGFFNPNSTGGIQQQRVTDTMWFKVTSSRYEWNGLYYDCFVKFLSWDDIGVDPDLTPREKALMLLWTSDIQLDCNDQSFKYWGYNYILNQLGAAIRTTGPGATIYPKIRNPQLRGVVCKHLNRVLKSLPFHSGDIAQEIINQFGGKLDQQTLDDIQRTNQLSIQANQGMGTPPEVMNPNLGQDTETASPGTMQQRMDQERAAPPAETPNENPPRNRSTDRRLPNPR